MKKMCRFFSTVFFIFVLTVSLMKLIKLMSKHNLIGILKGLGILCYDDADLVDISGNGSKLMSRKSQEGIEAFENYLDDMGYKFIGQFGSSNLYEHEGLEIVIKKSKLFGRFYLYEIFNERYFDESEAYSLV